MRRRARTQGVGLCIPGTACSKRHSSLRPPVLVAASVPGDKLPPTEGSRRSWSHLGCWQGGGLGGSCPGPRLHQRSWGSLPTWAKGHPESRQEVEATQQAGRQPGPHSRQRNANTFPGWVSTSSTAHVHGRCCHSAQERLPHSRKRGTFPGVPQNRQPASDRASSGLEFLPDPSTSRQVTGAPCGQDPPPDLIGLQNQNETVARADNGPCPFRQRDGVAQTRGSARCRLRPPTAARPDSHLGEPPDPLHGASYTRTTSLNTKTTTAPGNTTRAHTCAYARAHL